MQDYINESLLKDSEVFEELRNRLCSGPSPFNVYFPNSFDELSEEELKACYEVDELYKKGIITKEEALKLLEDIFSGGMMRKRFEAYQHEMLLNKLKELLKIKYMELEELHNALNNNLISKEEYFERARKSHRKFYNDLLIFLESRKSHENTMEEPERTYGGRTR